MEMDANPSTASALIPTMLMDAEPRSLSTLAVAIANFDLAPRRANNSLRRRLRRGGVSWPSGLRRSEL